jgi:hypothetical protein
MHRGSVPDTLTWGRSLAVFNCRPGRDQPLTGFAMIRRSFLGLFLALGVASAMAADKAEISDNAPDSYTVKQGDTLWAISGMFLKQPWRWPEVWKMNQDEIRNPHLIYPGQVVVLDRSNGTLSLGRTVASTGELVGGDRLSPRIYSKDASSPITSISLEAIRPFLAEPLVDENEGNAALPTIVANQEGRVLAGPFDTVYARNLSAETNAWDIYRRGKAIKDPVGGQILGYEAEFVARAQVTQPAVADKAAELKVLSAKQEIVAGDRLMPAAKSELFAYPPHAPKSTFVSSVAAVYGGVGIAGRNSVVTLAAGKNLGLEPGHVVALVRDNGKVVYRGEGKAEQVALPDSRIGLAYVFRSFNRVSYALIMDAQGMVKVGDKVSAP